jgi:hypothetical protein
VFTCASKLQQRQAKRKQVGEQLIFPKGEPGRQATSRAKLIILDLSLRIQYSTRLLEMYILKLAQDQTGIHIQEDRF